MYDPPFALLYQTTPDYKMKCPFVIIFLLYICNGVWAQTLTGCIKTQNEKPIEYADVILYNSTNVITHVQSDTEGFFYVKVEKVGRYKTTIRFMGKSILDTVIDVVTNVDLGVLRFNEIYELAEVSIIGRKPLIERKTDRLIFNVQNSVFSKGLNVDELLRNVPRIDPTTEDLKIVGKSTISVMINERLINMSGDNLKNYLKTLRSDDVEKIEVITSPSAQYDASGNSGLINIKLKKRSRAGLEGNISAGVNQRIKANSEVSSALNYSFKNLTLGYTIYNGNENRISKQQNNYDYVSQRRESSERNSVGNKGISQNFNVDYQINKSINLGAFANYRDWNSNLNRESAVKFINKQNDIIKRQVAPAETRGYNRGLSISPYLDVGLDSVGGKLKFFYNYNKNRANTNSNFRSDTYLKDYEKSLESVMNGTDITSGIYTHAIGLSFEKTIRKLKVDLGTKYTSFGNYNDLKYYNMTPELGVLTDSTSNTFKYNEKLLAAYFNFSQNFGEKWHVQFGIRYEHSNTKGNSITNTLISRRNYGNVFPNFSLSYDPNDDHSYSFSYNKRIFRPLLPDLNPFKIYNDANNYFAGNPDLSPNLTDNVELGFLYKSNLSVSFYGSRIANNWAYIVISQDGGNTIVTQPHNALTTYEAGCDIGYNWRISKKINNYSSFNCAFQKSLSTNDKIDDRKLQGMRSTLSSNTTFSLNKKDDKKIFINIFYNSPGVDEMYISKNIFLIKVGTSLSFVESRLTVNAFLTDPFNTTIARNTVNYESFQLKNRIFNDNRSFNVSIYYKIGTRKPRIVNNDVDNAETQRFIKSKS